MTDLRQRVEAELRDNILPFWIEHTLDEQEGGFYGALTNDLVVHNGAPRSAVLTARILWTYSAAYRLYHDEHYLIMARRAYDYLTQKFWDHDYGGVYWTLDQYGCPTNDRKHVYAQAFAIYGLAEFYRATGEPQSLALAQQLFDLIEAHSFDPIYGGNLECCSREWGALDDMRLSAKEPVTVRKSMNTLLHLMEAYTNLLRVWPAEELKAKQRGLIEIFLRHIIDPKTHQFKLFFDDAWHSLDNHISPGHDIEGSWLIVEAAEVQGDEDLLARTHAAAVQMAEAVTAYVDDDGAIIYEATPHGIESYDKHWWVQAEGLVGFTNAHQLSGRADFAQKADRLWNLIETFFVDHTNGDWYKVLDRNGAPLWYYYKVGPWECPYHHARACFEMLARLPAGE
ncbi:MAG TPA: AGE family epimerase/isomerase [Anaerolineae bacterium]|nr:AGE family epimerase/isomerase [Anaerolineae bacterium]